jgi:hypothetical protein
MESSTGARRKVKPDRTTKKPAAISTSAATGAIQ